jgi:hypothetical protein
MYMMDHTLEIFGMEERKRSEKGSATGNARRE